MDPSRYIVEHEQAKGTEATTASQRLLTIILSRYGFSLHEVVRVCSEKERRQLHTCLSLEEDCSYENDCGKEYTLPPISSQKEAEGIRHTIVGYNEETLSWALPHINFYGTQVEAAE
jgi:hypothetical protein